jgi:hypothetical protein
MAFCVLNLAGTTRSSAGDLLDRHFLPGIRKIGQSTDERFGSLIPTRGSALCLLGCIVRPSGSKRGIYPLHRRGCQRRGSTNLPCHSITQSATAKMLRNLASIVVILLAVSYHVFFRNFFFTFLGVGRSLRQIQEFPYTCHRLEHPSLSSCEDLWLDEENRTLYAACSDLPSRTQWLPA